MPEATDWQTLKDRCAEHDAELILRAETIDGDHRFSLAAKQVKQPHALIYDLRQNAGGNAPQFIVTTLVSQALEEWWV
jgi:hypothetical protein